MTAGRRSPRSLTHVLQVTILVATPQSHIGRPARAIAITRRTPPDSTESPMSPASLPPFSRRKLLGAFGVGAGALALSACGGGSLGGDDSSSGGGGGGGDGGGGTVRVGLVIPQAGVYTALGIDMSNGWELWLDQNGGMFGGYTVETVIADEGEGPADRGAGGAGGAAERQRRRRRRLVNSATALGVADQFTEAKKLLIVTNAGAVAITGDARTPYIWRTSFTNAQPPTAMGEHLRRPGRALGLRARPGLRSRPGGHRGLHRGVRGAGARSSARR